MTTTGDGQILPILTSSLGSGLELMTSLGIAIGINYKISCPHHKEVHSSVLELFDGVDIVKLRMSTSGCQLRRSMMEGRGS